MMDQYPRILRCSFVDEACWLEPSDQALIVEDGMSDLPEGYGLYLLPSGREISGKKRTNVHALPENCGAGSFVMSDKSGKLCVSQTADRPDRTLFCGGACNSNCIMCPYSTRFRRNSGLEEVQILKRFVTLMDPLSEYVCITGGEPTLLRDGFLKLVAQVKAHFDAPMLHILTNGRTFSYKSFVSAYRQVRPYMTVLGIPLHADNADLHDHITQAPGSFRETLAGLDNLYSAGERVELRVVTSRLNYLNLPSLARMIVERYPCCQRVCMMGLEMMGNAMINRKEVWINYDALWPYVREATGILLAGGVEVELYNYPLCVVNPELQPLNRKSITPSKVTFPPECERCRRRSACGGFFRTTMVMPDIKVYPY